MAKQNTAPTMKDVAREAGVSLGTVSKVINGIPVGDEYRKKVEQAIRTLDYHINAYAKGLKNNRTYTVAVIMPNLLNPFFSMVAHYINRALVKHGYRMLLCDTDYDYSKEQEMVQMAEQNKVDGIITLTYDPKLEVPSEINSVSIDRYLGVSLRSLPGMAEAQIYHIPLPELPRLEQDGSYGEVAMEKNDWKLRNKDYVKRILQYRPEAVYVEGDVFSAYPVVHLLRKKHVPVLAMAERGGDQFDLKFLDDPKKVYGTRRKPRK